MVVMSTGQLKWIALVCMFIDHIGEFIPQAPVWLRYIGRLALPLFFYCSAWGFYYTHDKKKYLLHLYAFSVLMGTGNFFLSYFMNRGMGVYLLNNIFTTIFLGCCIVYLWESAINWRVRIRYFLLYALYQIVAFFICVILTEPWRPWLMYELHYTCGTIFGSCIFTEGGILFVLYFICVYFLKEKKLLLSLFTCAFAGLLVFLDTRSWPPWGPVLYLFPFSGYQWLMVTVIPFYFLYNGTRGTYRKTFFYVFYPLHIWILFVMGYFIQNKAL